MKAFISLVLLSAMVVPLASQEYPYMQYDKDYLAGYEEGKSAGGSGISCVWAGVGCCLSPFGILPAIFAPEAQPPATAMMYLQNKPESFKIGYLKGYSQGAKNKVWTSVGLGTALGLAVELAIWYAWYTSQ